VRNPVLNISSALLENNHHRAWAFVAPHFSISFHICILIKEYEDICVWKLIT